MLPEAWPVEVGVKVTFMVQLWPAGIPLSKLQVPPEAMAKGPETAP